MCPIFGLIFKKLCCCGGANNDISDMSTEEGSPVPQSSGSSGLSDDDRDSLAIEHGAGYTLPEFVEHLKQKGRGGLWGEFNQIKANDNPAPRLFDVSRKEENKEKNRYGDILCLDHTRVILSSEGGYGSDYINANFVDGYRQKKAFISTQGPLPETSGAFWRMVWEQMSVIIAMTTPLMEGTEIKCDQYWPPEQGSSVMYDGIKIENLQVDSQPDFTLTRLRLTHEKTGQTRNVSHLHFLSWVDYSAPSSADGMLKFLKAIRAEQSNRVDELSGKWKGHALGPPIVVHCSAGIGRTGTLCTIDICINQLNGQGTVDVKGTVEKIRSQRSKSVPVFEQYIFCHRAIIEYARSKNLLSGYEADEVRFILQPPLI